MIACRDRSDRADRAEARVIGADVAIGPYCVVGPHVAIGDGCRLIAHVHHRRPHHDRRAHASIYPFASLGTPPQSVQLSRRADPLDDRRAIARSARASP